MRARSAQDPALVRFLDVFHHRMLSLFYRAWASSRPAVHADRPASDRFTVYVGSMFGQGTAAFRGRDAAPDAAKLHYAGRLSLQARNAEGLESILADFFDVPVELEPFHGRWIDIPEASRWRLGESPETGALGASTTVGARAWDRHLAFRLVVGPVGLERYEKFLPGGESLRRLDALVRNYAGDEFDWDVKLVLAREEVPPLRLGGPTRLGISTWLASRTPDRDPADLVLNPAGAR
jgi:type VI secretion system protein ImpH